jgi:hypothetical protein
MFIRCRPGLFRKLKSNSRQQAPNSNGTFDLSLISMRSWVRAPLNPVGERR